ncbi:SPOR domain-containing protein [Desulfovibrio sp. ZJ369]|uniref:SPOR domain-containing protein n=1 Tax=Desulfovibrio sp. ZJ369 TaxID=2709793 RepID=UPI00197D2FA4|nr:SPOR domain-containing protein [Desulfovibrio sp. ZJ369]
MVQPLRKVRVKNPSASGRQRRFTVSLSGAALAALGLVLMAAVGWSFFMGFMVGRGQNPEKRVGQITGMIAEEPAASDAARGASPAAPPDWPSPDQPVAPHDPDAAPQSAGTQHAESTAAMSPGTGNTAARTGAAQAAGAQNAAAALPADSQSASPAYPFSRPQGEGLAAWGISQHAGGTAPPTPAAQPQGGAQARPAASRGQAASQAAQSSQAPQVSQPKAPLFDWLFQAAAFKDKADADRLRARLEERGLRSRQQKSGKVLLVMVSLRGTELDAANLREELRRMKLGAPILAAKKPVSGKSRKSK